MDLLLPRMILQDDDTIDKPIPIEFLKSCDCTSNKLNCMTAKEWIKSQLGVWQFTYEKRDIRNKEVHPATFPISLSKRVIELFSHKGELILDPFVGEDVIIMLKGKNAVNKRISELPQSMKFEN